MVAGWAPFFEQIVSEEMREKMGLGFGEVSRTVLHTDSVVEKCIGEAVVAVSGSNRAGEDDALRAVHTTRQIRQSVYALNARHLRQALDVHCRINTGLIITGQITASACPMGVVGKGDHRAPSASARGHDAVRQPLSHVVLWLLVCSDVRLHRPGAP